MFDRPNIFRIVHLSRKFLAHLFSDHMAVGRGEIKVFVRKSAGRLAENWHGESDGYVSSANN